MIKLTFIFVPRMQAYLNGMRRFEMTIEGATELEISTGAVFFAGNDFTIL